MNRSLLVLQKLLWLFVVTTIVKTSSAQLNLSEQLPLDPRVKIGKLENGLTYYIRQNKKPEQRVELRLVVNAGSINEDDDQQGLAHMAEHMAFNGTTNFKKNEIVSFLQDIGVGFGNDLNAYTSFDETVYILPIPTDKPGNIEKGFQVLEDWAHNVTYLDEDIDNERAIILEESRSGKGANDRMFRQIYPKLFEGSKYASRLPIGKEEIIKNFKHDVIRRYYKDWYRPDLMAVIVVGDIDPAQAEKLVRKHFSGLTNPANARKREYAEVPPYRSSTAMVVTDKEATSYLVGINYPAFSVGPITTLGHYRNHLIKEIFTNLLNQRLQELTQKENPPFVYASVGFDSYARGYGAFGGFAASGTNDPQKALEALTEEIERVERFGFTEAELERIKKSMIASYERAYNNRDKNESENYVEECLRHFLRQDAIPGIEKEFEYVKALLPAITLQEVNAMVNRFKDQENRFVFLMGPEPSGDAKLPGEQDLLALVNAKSKADIKPYEEKAVTSELLRTMPKAGKVVARSTDKVLGTTELKLSNGVTVTLKPTTYKNDQILMGAIRPGGKNLYGVNDKFNAEFMANVIAAMGVGEFSPVDLRKALAGKSVNVSLAFNNLSEGIRGTSTVKDLETMFQLVYLHFTQPRKDTSLFRSFIQRNKAQYANISANPEAVFFDTLYKTLFQNHPLAPVPVPNSAYFDKVNLDRVLAMYKERFGNAYGMNFVFTGSFKEEELIPLIEKYIASLPAEKKEFAFTDNKVRPVKGIKTLTLHKGKEQKSMIIAVYTGETPYSEDLEMSAQALSEVMNIRIIEELREKIQGIYGGGTFASLTKFPYAKYEFMVQLPCGPEKVDTLLKALKKEMELMVKHGPDTSYLNKVKRQWIEQYKTQIQDNNTWRNQLLDYKLKGGNPDRFINYEKYVERLKPADVQQAAKLIFSGKNEFVAIQMPESDAESDNQDTKKGF
jgi:zinc protease